MLRHLRHLLSPEGDDAPAARQRMIEHDLVGRGIRAPRVIEVMARISRERFVPPVLAGEAYDDRAQPIGCEQTISQPYIVALMTEALELMPAHHVLEIGTGSGYQTAVLAELAHDVVTVERHAELSQRSQRILQELGYENIEFVIGDGTLGRAPAAPYDRILVTAAALALPPALWSQLADAGRIVAPLGPPDEQLLQVLSKQSGRREERTLTACRFVPLVGGRGPPPPSANLDGDSLS